MSTLYIPASIADKLPSLVKLELSKMEENTQTIFLDEYRRKRKNTGVAYLLWFILGLHYVYLGKLGWQIFYWLTGAGFLVWAIIDIFRIPSMVNEYNHDAAMDVLRNVKMLTT